MFEVGVELIVYILKAVITVASIMIVFGFIFSLAARSKDSKDGFELLNLSEQMRETVSKLRSKMMDKKERKAFLKNEKKKNKSKDKKAKAFVLDFKGDIKASEAENLKLCVTQCLKLLDPKDDEVVIRLESPGGLVSGYGLAASELSRFRENGLKVTVCVDKVAASGGYLMSCVADQIVAAPFAILGSIGVVAGMPNFNKLLKKNHIDYELLTAGKYKRTLTVFGENTDEGRKKFVDQLEQIHTLFKNFVSKYRPQLNIEEVATGEYWFGEDAIKLNLADKIQTSEDYLIELLKSKELYLLSHKEKKKWTEKLAESAQLKLFGPTNPTDFV
jgi:serine protease SohB